MIADNLTRRVQHTFAGGKKTASPPGTANSFTRNFEIKAFDGWANPYLGLASGIDGLRRNLSLPEPVVSLAESIEALEKDALFRYMIGEKLLVAIIGVCKAEIKYYSENKEGYKDLIFKVL